MAYTETIIVEPNTEIDTIQKALDAITTSNPVIYIKDGLYSVYSMNQMSITDKVITWIGESVNTIIEFEYNGILINYYGTVIFKKIRMRPSNNFTGDTRVLHYCGDTFPCEWHNVLFTKSLNNKYPYDGFFYLHNNTPIQTNKSFYNCTFCGKGIFGSLLIGKPNNLYNCVYDTSILSANGATGTITNCIKDDINQETFEPVNYGKTSSGIYYGNDPILLPSTASEIIKEIIYKKAKNILDNYLLLTYSKENDLNNVSIASLNIEEIEENESTFKDVLVSSMKEVIKNNLT